MICVYATNDKKSLYYLPKNMILFVPYTYINFENVFHAIFHTYKKNSFYQLFYKYQRIHTHRKYFA